MLLTDQALGSACTSLYRGDGARVRRARLQLRLLLRRRACAAGAVRAHVKPEREALVEDVRRRLGLEPGGGRIIPL